MITGWFTTMTMIRNILIITIIAALVPTAMSNVSASAASEIALFSSDSDSLSISGNGDNAKMKLKATNENGRTNKVSDFQLTADNVLYIKTGDTVAIKDRVDFTKAITTDAKNNPKAIGITSDGVIDFTGYSQGVSTLDVVVDNDRAYEAIIAIGQQTKEVVDKEITRANNKYVTEVEIKTVFSFPQYSKEKPSVCYFNPKHPDCEPKDGKCPAGFGFNDDDRCIPIGKCPDGYVRADDDETGTCFEKGKDDRIKECPDGSIRLIGDTCYYETPDECEPGYELRDGTCYEIPPEDEDPCRGLDHIPEDRDCDGQIDPEFGPFPVDCIGGPPCPNEEALIQPEPEPEPELIECGEGEELVDGQCQLIATNPEEPYDLVPIEGEELDDPEEELDEVPEEEEAEEESGGSEDEVENDDDEEGGGDSEQSNEGEESDDSGETSA
jgi:hypothetical protein